MRIDSRREPRPPRAELRSALHQLGAGQLRRHPAHRRGLEGIGESDVNPWIAKACLEAPGTHTMGLCMKELLLGADPFDIEGIWRRIYLGTAMNGRRGAVVHALGAVEMALWDLKGKALGKPVHELLGGAVRDTDRALRLAAAGRAQLRGVPRRAGRIGRAGQGAGLQGGQVRGDHERALRPFRPARELRAAHRGGGRGAQGAGAGRHADDRRPVPVGGRGDLPRGGQGLGRVRHLLPRDADLVGQSRRVPQARRGGADARSRPASGWRPGTSSPSSWTAARCRWRSPTSAGSAGWARPRRCARWRRSAG